MSPMKLRKLIKSKPLSVYMVALTRFTLKSSSPFVFALNFVTSFSKSSSPLVYASWFGSTQHQGNCLLRMLTPSSGLQQLTDLALNLFESCHSTIFVCNVWILIHNKLPSYENLMVRGCHMHAISILGKSDSETLKHLFLNYNIALKFWNWLQNIISIPIDTSSIISILNAHLQSLQPLFSTFIALYFKNHCLHFMLR